MRSVAIVTAAALLVGCSGKPNASKPGEVGGGQSSKSASQGQDATATDKAAFIEFVKKHAQKPNGLEIIELGMPRVEKADGPGQFYDTADPGNKPYLRNVAFRCEVIDLDRERKQGISRDNATVYFSAPGKISRLHLNQCQCWWNAPPNSVGK